MTIEHRVDRLARRLAGSEPGIYSSMSTPAPTVESVFDCLARVLAGPVTRRRALAAAGGAVAAASLLRPPRAHADCFPGGPQICESSHGMRVCAPANLKCCSNENCAIACPYPWRDCEAPAICSDTARMCRDPAAGFAKDQTKFCSQRVSVTNGCVASGSSVATRGWCCRPTESCGTEFGSCVCFNPCGDECCKKDEDCVNVGFFRGSHCFPKCRAGWHHEGEECVCNKGQTCGLVCCPAGTVCSGSSCVSPPPPGKWPSIFDGFLGFGDAVNQSAASRGGGHSRDAVIAAVTTPVNVALLALAAVNAQATAAGTSFGDDHFDAAYRRKVVVSRPSPPRLQSGIGLDPRAASALQALLAVESQGFALMLASATAVARARGALLHRDSAAALKQVSAAAGFADKAARALRRAASLRATAAATLRSTGATEVVVTPADVLAMQAGVRATGVPVDLRSALARLGVQGDDLGRVREALLANSAGGPVLIAPLADPARTQNIQSMATELALFSKRARERPISRSHGQAQRYRQR